MAGYDAEKARQVFEIPAGWEPIAAMAIGYPGDANTLPENLRERETRGANTKTAGQICYDRDLGPKSDIPALKSGRFIPRNEQHP